MIFFFVEKRLHLANIGAKSLLRNPDPRTLIHWAYLCKEENNGLKKREKKGLKHMKTRKKSRDCVSYIKSLDLEQKLWLNWGFGTPIPESLLTELICAKIMALNDWNIWKWVTKPGNHTTY